MRGRGGRACGVPLPSLGNTAPIPSAAFGNRRCGACLGHANEPTNAGGAAIRAHVARAARQRQPASPDKTTTALRATRRGDRSSYRSDAGRGAAAARSHLHRHNMRSLLAALLAARTAAQCPSPYEGTSVDACFLISDFPATFSQCQQHCESNGGSLATIKNKEEDDYVRQLVTTQRAVWIGLFESGEQDESGVWEWVNDCVEINQCVGCTSSLSLFSAMTRPSWPR